MWRIGPFLLLAAAAGLLGCGGGGSAPPAPPTGPADEPVFGPDVRLNTDGPGFELSQVPQICCEGERIYVVWYDRRGGFLDVYFNRSLDSGTTWLERDMRLDTPAGTSTSLIPRMCCAGPAIYVAWYDDRDGKTDIYFNRSLDSGTTWLATDVRLDTDDAGSGQSREPAICCDGSNVCVAWFDDRDGSWDIRANRSLDGGTTWLADDVRVDREPGATRAELPRLCCHGNVVYAAWVDERRGGRDVYANRSLDGGALWGADDTRLNTLGLQASAPAIACTATRVYVAWHDARSGLRDIHCNVSADEGATWLASDVRLDSDIAGAAQSLAPALCAEDDAVYVVWRDQRNGDDDVYFNRSLDGGSSWLADDRRIGDDFPGVNTAFDPGISCRSGRLCATWRDDRNGRFDVFLSLSPDAGATWLAADVRMDTDEPGSGHSISPLVCCAPGRAFVVWYDQRDGPGDVYFNRVDTAALNP